MIHPKKSPCFIEFSPVFCGFPEVLIGSQNERAVCDGFFWLEHRKEGGAIHHIAGFLGKHMIQAGWSGGFVAANGSFATVLCNLGYLLVRSHDEYELRIMGPFLP